MHELVKKDIILILREAIKILEVEEEGDVIELRQLSDHTVHNSSIFQDEDSISIAVIIYALFKISKNEKELDKEIVTEFDTAKSYLLENNIQEYRNRIKKLFHLISLTDSKTRFYVREVIEHALIKKGSRIFEHGISLARVSSILGISQWELMDYIGKTNIADTFADIKNVEDKIKFTRTQFS